MIVLLPFLTQDVTLAHIWTKKDLAQYVDFMLDLEN